VFPRRLAHCSLQCYHRRVRVHKGVCWAEKGWVAASTAHEHVRSAVAGGRVAAAAAAAAALQVVLLLSQHAGKLPRCCGAVSHASMKVVVAVTAPAKALLL
jgi:hypothetical protein